MVRGQNGQGVDPVQRRPSLHDVGQLAGVSHQTVSRVLNGHPHVKSVTRERVLQAISELDYRPNTAARALASKKSATIGVLTPASTLLGPTSTAVAWAARDAGYFLSLAVVRTQDRRGLRSSLHHFISQAVEGIVVIEPLDFAAEVMAEFTDHVPVVVVADASSAPQVHSVSVDQAAGANLVVSHLTQLGHRDIVHLAGPQDWFDARARMSGWRSVMESKGLPTPAVMHGDWTPESGYQAGVSLLGSALPDAVFAGNDGMALGLLRAFRQYGVDVPRDVSVVGFDDIDGSAFYDPPLTTVRQDFAALGALAMHRLLELMTNTTATEPTSLKITPSLIVRQSSAAQPKARRRRRARRDPLSDGVDHRPRANR